MKWRLCDCGTPMLSWCRLCARQTDRDIDRLLGTYDETGQELQPDQLPVGWTRPGEGALRTDALPVPPRVFDDITRLMASVNAEVERTLTRYLMPERGPPYQHPHHVHDDPVMVFIGGPWDGHTEAPFAGNYLNVDDGDPDRTEPFTYQIIGGLNGARRRYALPAGINPTKWAARTLISDEVMVRSNGAHELQQTINHMGHSLTVDLARDHLTPLLPTYEVDWQHDQIRCMWEVRALVLALPRQNERIHRPLPEITWASVTASSVTLTREPIQPTAITPDEALGQFLRSRLGLPVDQHLLGRWPRPISDG